MKEADLSGSFSRAAKTYASVSDRQRRTGRALVELLPGDFSPTALLDLGCGDGEHTLHLAQRFPTARVSAVDLAPGMLEQARSRPGGSAVAWHESDMDDTAWWPVDACELVFSNMALQWSRDGEAVVRRVRLALRHGGYFALALFLVDSCAELGTVFREEGIRLLPRPGFHAGDWWSRALADAALTTVFSSERREVDYFPDILTLLRHLRSLGAVSGMEGYLTPGALRRLEARWRKRFPDTRGLPLTWHFGLHLARRLLP